MACIGRPDAITVQYLDLVVAVKDHPGIGALGHHELNMDFHITVVASLGHQAGALALLAVDQHPGARPAHQATVILGTQHCVTGHLPFVAVVPGIKTAS